MESETKTITNLKLYCGEAKINHANCKIILVDFKLENTFKSQISTRIVQESSWKIRNWEIYLLNISSFSNNFRQHMLLENFATCTQSCAITKVIYVWWIVSKCPDSTEGYLSHVFTQLNVFKGIWRRAFCPRVGVR